MAHKPSTIIDRLSKKRSLNAREQRELDRALKRETQEHVDRAQAHLSQACVEWISTGYSLTNLMLFLYEVYARESQASVRSGESKESEHWHDMREAAIGFDIDQQDFDEMPVHPKKHTPKL
jgi:hypothetical protein